MLDRNLNCANRRAREAEQAHGVDDVHRQIDDRHLVIRHLAHHLAGQHRCICEEQDADDVDQRGKRPADTRRQQSVKEVDVDMPLHPHHRRHADEHHADQQITRDLLGPRGRIVQHVARKELIENRRGQHPEQHERDPRFERVMRKIDRRVVGVEMPRFVDDMLVGDDGAWGGD